MNQRESLLDRFVRYAKIDTQSSETSTTYPSTEKQKDLLRVLVDDLKAAGLADAGMDEWGYVMGTLPSNLPDGHAAHGAVPTIGLIAHVDTYFGVTGTTRQPAGASRLRRRRHRAARRSVTGDPRGRRSRARRVPRPHHHHDGRHDAARRRRQGGRRGDPRGAVAVAGAPAAAARADPGGLHPGRGGRPRHRALRREGVRRRHRVHHRRVRPRLARGRDVLRRHRLRHRRGGRRPPGLRQEQDGERGARA